MPSLPCGVVDVNEQLLQDDTFREAIYLASGALFEKMQCHSADNMSEKVRKALFRYLVRMSSRCTPFGLFAGCGIGTIDTKSSIVPGANPFRTKTTPTLRCLLLINQLLPHSGRYYPNTTLFRVADFYRYIEPKFDGKQLKYLFSEVPWSPYLENILQIAVNGVLQEDLIQLLIDTEGADREEAAEFINDLIESHVIESEFSVRITLEDNIGYYIARLTALEDLPDMVTFLTAMKRLMQRTDDQPLGQKLPVYQRLQSMLNNKLGHSGLFQTNLYVQPESATLGKDVVELASKGLEILNMLSPYYEDQEMADFKRKFFERYELEEIPLAEALDPDIGVSYGNFAQGGIGKNSLTAGLTGAQKSSNISSNILVNRILVQKYHEYLAGDQTCITITDKDLKGIQANWDDLPVTLSVGFDLVKPGIFIKYAGGYSAVNTLARFGGNNDAFLQCAREITAYEDTWFGQTHIVADIVHITEDIDLGNVLKRPTLRQYEIPLLSFHAGEQTTAIPICDIMISMTADHSLRLRSTRLNKYIIPRNTTAHNFKNRTNPLYHFLSSCQGEGHIRGSLLLDWGDLHPVDAYYPRVMYGDNIVLAGAKWLIYPGDFTGKSNFREQLSAMMIARNIPHTVYLTSGFDTRVILDLSNNDNLALLQQELANGIVTLEECLLDHEASFIKGGYSHEVVLNYFKTR